MAIYKIAIFLISLTLLSCNNFKDNQSNTNSLIKTDVAITTLSKKSLVDSLIRFSFLDEFTKRDDSSKYVLHSEVINGIKVGLIALTDSTLFLYQGTNKMLKLTDSIKFDTYAFSFETSDLNGDNKDDFIVNSVPDVYGQSTPYVFIFQNKLKKYFNYC